MLWKLQSGQHHGITNQWNSYGYYVGISLISTFTINFNNNEM